MKIHNKIFLYQLLFFLISSTLYTSEASQKEFDKWLITYKKYALQKGVSQKTIDLAFKDVKFLEKVIGYDRKQPEFYEDTITYISKRANKSRLKKANKLLKQNKKLFNDIENNFLVEKELLLSLWGIETNFGTYVGKMDILSSLATLSFDKRRSEFFTNELLILLRLIENEQIDYKTLYGSWAGAFGFFQFMPSTMKNYAIDHDGNGYIDLKNNNDAYASASNYLNQIGWKSENPCFYRIDLSEDIPSKYLNISAKKLHHKKKLEYFRKYIKNNDLIDYKYNKLNIAIITPDKDIIPDAETLNPAYIVFDNYEIILKWNRSLRFALAVCTLKDKFKNAL